MISTATEWLSIARMWEQIEDDLARPGAAIRRCPADQMLSDRIGFRGDRAGTAVYKCRWCNDVWVEQ